MPNDAEMILRVAAAADLPTAEKIDLTEPAEFDLRVEVDGNDIDSVWGVVPKGKTPIDIVEGLLKQQFRKPVKVKPAGVNKSFLTKLAIPVILKVDDDITIKVEVKHKNGRKIKPA